MLRCVPRTPLPVVMCMPRGPIAKRYVQITWGIMDTMFVVPMFVAAGPGEESYITAWLPCTGEGREYIPGENASGLLLESTIGC